MNFYANNILNWRKLENPNNLISQAANWGTDGANIRMTIGWDFDFTYNITANPLPIHFYAPFADNQTVYNTLTIYFKPSINIPA